MEVVTSYHFLLASELSDVTNSSTNKNCKSYQPLLISASIKLLHFEAVFRKLKASCSSIILDNSSTWFSKPISKFFCYSSFFFYVRAPQDQTVLETSTSCYIRLGKMLIKSLSLVIHLNQLLLKAWRFGWLLKKLFEWIFRYKT